MNRGDEPLRPLLGGIFSDVMFAKFMFLGRLWAQFIALFGEGLMFFAIAKCTKNLILHALSAQDAHVTAAPASWPIPLAHW